MTVMCMPKSEHSDNIDDKSEDTDCHEFIQSLYI